MPKIKLFILLMLFLPVLAFGEVPDNENRRDAVIMYGAASDAQCTTIADHYALTVEFYCPDLDIIQSINPDFLGFEYISAEDAQVSGSAESTYVDSCATANGKNYETFFMHYWDSTVVTGIGGPYYCGGLENATTLADSVNCRVHIYSATRFLSNLYSADCRQYRKQYACAVLSDSFSSQGTCTDGYPQGIFWDNGSACLFNRGTLSYGGHVAEHPSHARIDSIGCDYLNWWFDSCLKPFYQEVLDTFETATSWSLDNRIKYSGANITGSWTYDFSDSSTLHYIFPEFEANWTARASFLQGYYQHDSAATAKGRCYVHAPYTYTSCSPGEGSCSYSEALYRNLCWFYTICSDSSYHMVIGLSNDPASAGWDTLVWCGAFNYDLGDPLGVYEADTSGTDGSGYSYTVYKREFDNGIVYLRPRNPWNADCDTLTEVTVLLDGTYNELTPHGEWTAAKDSILIWNGDGVIVGTASSASPTRLPFRK